MMKKTLLLIGLIAALLMAGCSARSSGKRSNDQELRKSPCASLEIEVKRNAWG